MRDVVKEAVLCALVFASAGACTVIYDGDVFAEADARIDIIPAELLADSLEPSSLNEGQGASPMGRAVPLVVHGSNIGPGTRIAITGGGLDLDVEAQTSADGTMAATTLRLPVDTELAAGSTVPISIKLYNDLTESSLDLQLRGLSELSELSGQVDTSTLAALYSRIEIGQAIELVGDDVARFVATDSILISAAVEANGREDGERSAGGFLGGLPEQDGGGDSGGARGTQTAGGGGGGNLEKGGGGQGAGAGAGGDPVDAPFLFPLVGVVGHGGGGGGGAALGSAPGGAGGGAIELSAGGVLTIAAGASLSANGADGSSTGNCSLGGGGGGGGAGGAVLLRAAAELVFEEGASATVLGGVGGSEDAIGSCKGGDGSQGRVRADFPQAQGNPPTTVRGPSFVLSSVPEIVTSAELEVSITGEVGATYFLRINDVAQGTVTLSSATAESAITLSAGLNEVCALVAQDANQGQPESLNCVSVAYLASP